MKRCPSCGSVSPDSELTCGACGSSIADVQFETMEQIDAERMADEKREETRERKEFEKKKIRLVVRNAVALSVSITFILAGFYLLLDQNSVYGIFVVMAGFVILIMVLDAGPFWGNNPWWKFWGPGGAQVYLGPASAVTNAAE